MNLGQFFEVNLNGRVGFDPQTTIRIASNRCEIELQDSQIKLRLLCKTTKIGNNLTQFSAPHPVAKNPHLAGDMPQGIRDFEGAEILGLLSIPGGTEKPGIILAKKEDIGQGERIFFVETEIKVQALQAEGLYFVFATENDQFYVNRNVFQTTSTGGDTNEPNN